MSFSRDSNSNGIVSYRLQQDSFLFSIDHYSGEIRLKNRPERYLSMNALDILNYWKNTENSSCQEKVLIHACLTLYRLEARYEVVVVASDEGVASERRSATASVTILGLDSRDKGPPCSQVQGL